MIEVLQLPMKVCGLYCVYYIAMAGVNMAFSWFAKSARVGA